MAARLKRSRKTELSVCQCCYVSAEYGYDEGANEEEQAAADEGLERFDLSRGHFAHGGKTDDFSTRRCDCCRSHLAGERYSLAYVRIY